MTGGRSCLRCGGRGPHLLFLHGVGGSAHAFAPQLRHFGRNFRAIAWNFPGYGGTPPCLPLSFPALRTALLGFLDGEGIDRVHLVGHSMGGMLAQEVAAVAPERIASMALVATSAAFGSSDDTFRRRFLAERLAPLGEGRSMADLAPELVASLVGEGPDPAGVALAVECMSRLPETIYRAALDCLVTFDRRDALAGHRMPVLLVAGERDRAAPPRTMRRMAERIPAGRFVEVEGAGHLVHLERPDVFNRILERFLHAVS